MKKLVNRLYVSINEKSLQNLGLNLGLSKSNHTK